MKYYCCLCFRYWDSEEPHIPYISPVRDCPECLKKRGKKWIDVANFIQDDIQ